jgi:hypothetical protein
MFDSGLLPDFRATRDLTSCPDILGIAMRKSRFSDEQKVKMSREACEISVSVMAQQHRCIA